MHFYAGNYFDNFAEQRKSSITSDVNSQNDSYILNVNVDDYTDYLVQKYQLDIPEFYFENVSVDMVEQDIPGDKFPSAFMIRDTNKSFKKQVIIYHLPYSGNIELLQLRPNPMFLISYKAKIDIALKRLVIEIINFYNEPEKIKKMYNEHIANLTSNYENLKKDFVIFNNNLPSIVRNIIQSRKQIVLEANSLLSSLGVPIRKKEDISETFSIPNPKLKEKIIIKPVVLEKGFKPEPALDGTNYNKILKIINDVGKNFERMPSTYKGKSEEDIRDHILLILDPNFELGSAGGETFNKTGKTDISLRYDSSVVFVAECKYWKGEKSFLGTIDQLLGYLTWRNSKVAIINFVQNSEFTDVLTKVKSSIKIHPNFKKELNDSEETWFNYKFHFTGDNNREIDLAVISFHLPK